MLDAAAPLPTAVSTTAFPTGFLLMASLIVALGAQNAHVIRQGLRREHVGLVVALCALLDVLLTVVGVSGVAAALGSQPRLLDALALAGAGFLAWYAWGAARRALGHAALDTAAEGPARPAGQVVAATLAVTLLNPHVYLDTVLLVGTVGARQGPGGQGAFIAGAGLASTLWFALIGYGARAAAPVLRRPAAWRVLEALVALTMAFIATGLVLDVLAG